MFKIKADNWIIKSLMMGEMRVGMLSKISTSIEVMCMNGMMILQYILRRDVLYVS